MIDALFSRHLTANTGRTNSLTQLSDPTDKIDKKKWQNTVLVICCVRLGMKSVEREYIDVLRSFFHCTLNVGILGGRPGEAYYLVGIQEDFLIFLDPHCTNDAVANDILEIKKSHMNYHESTAKKIHFSKLDPSLGFCFLIKKESDYEKLRTFINAGKRVHKKSWIFNAMDKKPDFMKSRKDDSKNFWESKSDKPRNTIQGNQA